MLVIWFGALLVIAGVLYLVRRAIWKGPLSGADPARTRAAPDTLEPPGRGRDITIFALSRNWPGLVLVVLGAAFLLIGFVA